MTFQQAVSAALSKTSSCQLLKRVLEEHNPEHVIIEASGLAEPAPCDRCAALARPFAHLVELDAVVAVVDAEQLLAGRYTQGEISPDSDVPEHVVSIRSVFAEQLEPADLVLLNRAEVLDDNSLRTRRIVGTLG